MLKGIPKILPPELLKILCEMGHTDELTIGDGNFPGTTYGKKVIRMDGHGVPEILDAILQVFPLDTYVEHPVTLMAVVKGDTVETPIWDTYKEIVRKYDDRGDACFEEIDKWEFYDKTKEHSSVVIQTGESALYANIILKKGVKGFFKTDIETKSIEESREIVNEENKKLGISKAQASAMYWGSLYGFDTPGADPTLYDVNGRMINNKRADRGEAR